MRYDVKERLRTVLTATGLLPAAKYLYRVRYWGRHLRHEHRADRIRAGKDSRLCPGLKAYKDIHAGQRCFIVATGPSLTLEDVEKLRGEVTFSMNSIVKLFDKTDWRPTYYGIQDSNVYEALSGDTYFRALKERFVADTLQESHGAGGPGDVVFSLDLLDHMYYRPKTFTTKFSDDAYAVVYDGGTITYSLMQIAVYMGFREIYLLGCDCNYSGPKQHFADYGVPVLDDPSERQRASFREARAWAEDHGVSIKNATRGGVLGGIPARGPGRDRQGLTRAAGPAVPPRHARRLCEEAAA